MRKRTVMVVEDELIVAEDLTRWLMALGYTVGARAATAQEAVQRCEATRPDLVLMDILLPGDMDGIQAAEVIRRRFDIPVVYLTASSDDATLARAKLTEPFGYILKPFDERGLHSTIEMALYKHESEKRIRNSEERFRLLYESAPVAFQSLDADAHIVQVNNAWQDLFGFTQEEVSGHWFGGYLSASSVEQFIASFSRFRQSPATESITLDVVKRDGRVISATFKGSIAVDHRGLFEMTQCVLESRLHPRSASGTDSRGRGGGGGETGGVVPFHGSWLLSSHDGVILGITSAFGLLVGLPADRLCGMLLKDLCSVSADARGLVDQLAGTGTLDVRMLALRHASGERLDVNVTGFRFRGQGSSGGSWCLHVEKS
jgi:PAS domain S-box-containing protein